MGDRQPIGDYASFGQGSFVKWEDGQDFRVVITNWGKTKETYHDDKTGKDRVGEAIEADVLRINDTEFLMGEKVLKNGSQSFKSAIIPFLEAADKAGKKALHLSVSRKGTSDRTTYFIKELEAPTTQAKIVE